MSWPDLSDATEGVIGEVFGESVTYQPAAGGSVALYRPFRRQHVEIDRGDGVSVSEVATTLEVRLSELPAEPTTGDHVVRGAERWRVHDVHPNGHGAATLLLRKAAVA